MTGRSPLEAPGARVPRLLRHLGINLALGAMVGVAFTALLLALNIANLRDLIANSGSAALAVFMIGFVNVLTFGSLSMGTGIMLLPRDEPDDSIS